MILNAKYHLYLQPKIFLVVLHSNIKKVWLALLRMAVLKPPFGGVLIKAIYDCRLELCPELLCLLFGM